jgi:aspartyl/glutamyl-tRNA(Asn/Gln) amidotransferase C subunit
MPVVIDEERVRRIAKLARLKLSDAEVRLFAGQLGVIVGYIDQLTQVDTREAQPLAHPLAVTDVTREDAPVPGLDAGAALANAPQRESDYFCVPAVLGDASGA